MSEWINAMHRSTKKKKKTKTNKNKSATNMVNVAFSVTHGEELKKPLETWVMVDAVEDWSSEWRRPLQSLDMRGARDVYPAIHMTFSSQVLSHSTRNTLGEKYSLGVYFLLVYICQLICTNLFPLLANIKRHLLYNSKMQKKE